MAAAVAFTLKGRLGHDDGDITDVRVLNPILHLTGKGLHYEAERRDVEMLAHELGLDGPNAKTDVTPGIKPTYEHVAPPGASTDGNGIPAMGIKHRSFHVRVTLLFRFLEFLPAQKNVANTPRRSTSRPPLLAHARLSAYHMGMANTLA